MMNGVKTYTSEGLNVYSRGIRKGETDSYGVSGVTPGTTATKTVYGPQIVKVTIQKQVNGQTLSGEDMVRNLIQYYIDHPYYNFGGIDSYLDYSDRIEFLIYASDTNTSGTFAFQSANSDGYEVYARKEFDPQDTDFDQYYVYVKYTEDGNEDDAFGYYTNLKTGMLSSTTYISAMLTPDAQIEPDGTITAKIGKITKCYKKGELVYDKNGDLVAEMESVPKYETKTVQVTKTQ